MAQESNNVKYPVKIDKLSISGEELYLLIEMNGQCFPLGIDKASFEQWLTQGTGKISWVEPYIVDHESMQSGSNKATQGESPLSEYWDLLSVDDSSHKSHVKNFIEQDMYLLAACTAEMYYNLISYNEMPLEEKTNAMTEYGSLCVSMGQLHTIRQITTPEGFKYTKEIKIC